MSLKTLKAKYVWPDPMPTVPPLVHGWWSGAKHFSHFVGPQVKVYAEVGSWLGKSATWFAEQCPNATIICVDHWEGSAEHKKNVEWNAMLPTLYDTFLVNMKDYKDRLIPLRTDSVNGMHEMHYHGVTPDILYIDASHDEENVYKDLITALKLFPEAKIIGDDWKYGPVKAGVLRALGELDMLGRLVEAGNVFSLKG
jgi:hypothetical protein